VLTVTTGGLDWPALAAHLESSGFALTPPLVTSAECALLVDLFDEDTAFRSTVVMARFQYGRGVYRYFDNPLPDVVARLRTQLYPPLARIANDWAARLGEPRFPDELDSLLGMCAAAGQHRPTPLLLRYGPGDYNCLHQDIYGEVTFPLQVAIMLSRPDVDFAGGENVFVEQRPRAQSRPVVARPGQCQGLIFPVRHRPVPARQGDKRVAMRHGVSEVHSGQRDVLGIIFHDAR
jgi:uncharacterized protein